MPTLQQTANALRQGLDWCKQTGKARAWNMRILSGGLTILLSYDHDEWRLALRREGVPPSVVETNLCAAAFDVPGGTEPRARTVTERHPKTGRKITYRVVEMVWRERDNYPLDGGHPLSHAFATYPPCEGPDEMLAPGASR